MTAGSNKNVAFIAFIAVMVPILVGAWFALPMFVPMFMWTKVDLKKISAQSRVDEARLSTRFDMQVRYNPRGEGDPVPWQIITMNPPWSSVYPDAEDEDKLLVRASFVSGNDGQPPGTTFINGTFKDRYYRVAGLRLPPGTFGMNPKRPVVLYEASTLSRLSITDADMMQRAVTAWENDDSWQDDGWSPPP